MASSLSYKNKTSTPLQTRNQYRLKDTNVTENILFDAMEYKLETPPVSIQISKIRYQDSKISVWQIIGISQETSYHLMKQRVKDDMRV
jgi:hypothetical protein